MTNRQCPEIHYSTIPDVAKRYAEFAPELYSGVTQCRVLTHVHPAVRRLRQIPAQDP